MRLKGSSPFHATNLKIFGYTFLPSDAFSLSFDVGAKTGNWSAIGTSTQPPARVDLFAAWIENQNVDAPVSYSVFPATDFATFHAKSLALRLQDIQNDANVAAVFDETHKTASIVFWGAGGGSVYFVPSGGNAGVIYCMDNGVITVSDPSQTLVSVQIMFTLDDFGTRPPCWGYGRIKVLLLNLPGGGLTGSSVSRNIEDL
jgi:hypothetical protein